jgi:ubiquinone/menaquinone biosynthesis C-methylase UbiE
LRTALQIRRVKKFNGVLQILAFNWTLYALAALVILVLLTLSLRFTIPPTLKLVLYPAMALASFWMLSSLLVSHYVYDRSRLYRWDWLAPLFKTPPGHWANIHAGLDQTTDALERLFPDPARKVLDIYNASSMTEPSIKRARHRANGPPQAEHAEASSLPLRDSECDAVFLIFAAHELRSCDDRQRLFLEVSRSLRTGGQVIVAEHLRDWANFLAYGPGAFHFHSRKEWQASWRITGLEVDREISITPFVSCFSLTKHRNIKTLSHLQMRCEPRPTSG